MKKLKYIFLLPVLMFAFGIGIQSCGDNTDFSKPHILTDDEMRELQRQQAIKDSLKQVINADTILYYRIDTNPNTSWAVAGEVHPDFGALGAVFGLTEQQVIEALSQAPGAADVVNVVIQGTTHADQSTSSSNQTNGLWGHWYQYNGDAVVSGYSEENSRFYVEWAGYYDDEEGGCIDPFFNVGLFPERGQDGDHYQAIECFICNDARAALVIDIYVTGFEDIGGDVASTLNIDGFIEYNGGYETTDIPYDMMSIVETVGAPSWEDVLWVAKNADGSYFQEQDAGDGRGNGGFWFGQDGYKGSWGDSASVYVTFPTDEYVDAFAAAPMPGVFTEGSTVTVHCAATYGDKIVEINLNITCGKAASMVNDVVYSKEYDVTQIYDTGYATLPIAIETDAILEALGIEDLNDANFVSYDENGELTKDKTSNSGFYFNADGSVGQWGDMAVIFIEYYGSQEDDTYNSIAVGMHPDVTNEERGYESGAVVPAVVGFYANDKVALIKVNWQLGEENIGFE